MQGRKRNFAPITATYFTEKFLEPIILPSANTLTLYVPSPRNSFTFQYIVTGVSFPVYSMVFFIE